MIKLRNLYFSIYILFSVTVISCQYKVIGLTKDELKWFSPYSRTDTVVFVSKKMEFDTIVFFKERIDSNKVRNLEQGYYNSKSFSVSYILTKGSYHQFALMGDGKTRYDQEIVSLNKNSNNTGTFEITFLGTIFNGKELDNIKKLDLDSYYFDSANSTYHGMDVEKGIKNFTFDTKLGIVKYTDDRNIKWERK